MSTFTQFNGPLGTGGPTTRDITGFIDAYNKLSNTLNEHESALLGPDKDPHGIKEYIKTSIDLLEREVHGNARNFSIILDDITPVENALDAVEKLYNLIQQKADNNSISTLENTVANKAEQADLEALEANVNTKANSANVYNKSEVYNKQEADNSFATKEEIANVVEQDEYNKAVLKVFEATEYLKGKLWASKYIDFTDWKLVALQFAGTGSPNDAFTNGLYVIGKLSTNWDGQHKPATDKGIYKAARAFIKYEDGSPFDAIIDMTCTKHNDTFTGAINAIVSKKPGSWDNLRFHLVRCTYGDNSEEAVYLCMSADGLDKSVQDFNQPWVNLSVYACGINFIPLDGQEAAKVSKVDDVIISTAGVKGNQSSGVIASSIALNNLNLDTIHDSLGNPIFDVQHAVDDDGTISNHLIIGDKTTKTVQFFKRPSLLTKDPENPDHFIIDDTFATVKDLQSLSGIPLGAILDWPLYEEVYEFDEQGNPVINKLTGEPIIKMLRAIEVPEGFLATDGSDIDSIDYPDYSVLVHHKHDVTFKLPLRDCGIIKVKMDIINNNDAAAPERITVLNYNQLIDRINDTRSRLSAEVERSTSVDTAHDTAISDEATRAITAETNLATAISDEATRATTAETNLANSISDEATRATTAETNLANSISDEATRATAAETNLANSISDEATRATAEEQRLNTAISNEATRATAAETNLNTKINTEATIRSSQVNVLDQNKADKGTANPVITFAGIPTVTPGVTYQNGQRAYDSVGDKKYVYKFEETWTVDENGNPASSQFAGWIEVGSGQWS